MCNLRNMHRLRAAAGKKMQYLVLEHGYAARHSARARSHVELRRGVVADEPGAEIAAEEGVGVRP